MKTFIYCVGIGLSLIILCLGIVGLDDYIKFEARFFAGFVLFITSVIVVIVKIVDEGIIDPNETTDRTGPK